MDKKLGKCITCFDLISTKIEGNFFMKVEYVKVEFNDTRSCNILFLYLSDMFFFL